MYLYTYRTIKNAKSNIAYSFEERFYKGNRLTLPDCSCFHNYLQKKSGNNKLGIQRSKNELKFEFGDFSQPFTLTFWSHGSFFDVFLCCRDGVPYCEADYHAQYGVKCEGCCRYISGRVLEVRMENTFSGGTTLTEISLC